MKGRKGEKLGRARESVGKTEGNAIRIQDVQV